MAAWGRGVWKKPSGFEGKCPQRWPNSVIWKVRRRECWQNEKTVRGRWCVGFSVFGHLPGGKHTLDRQMLADRRNCVFPVDCREFYKSLRVKLFLASIGEKSFWSHTLQRIDRSDEVRTEDLLLPKWGKSQNFHEKSILGVTFWGVTCDSQW